MRHMLDLASKKGIKVDKETASRLVEGALGLIRLRNGSAKHDQ